LGLGSRLRRGDLENASVRPPRRLRCCFGRLPLARGIRGDGIRRGRAHLARSRCLSFFAGTIKRGHVFARRSLKGGSIIAWSSTVKVPEIVARMVRAEREGASSV